MALEDQQETPESGPPASAERDAPGFTIGQLPPGVTVADIIRRNEEQVAAVAPSPVPGQSAAHIDSRFAQERLAEKVRSFEFALQAIEQISTPKISYMQIHDAIARFVDGELLRTMPDLLQRIVRSVLVLTKNPEFAFGSLNYLNRGVFEALCKAGNSRTVQRLNLGILQGAGLLKEEFRPNEIGRGWGVGTLEVFGAVGEDAGFKMCSGELILHGHASSGLGREMAGGTIQSSLASGSIGEGMKGGHIRVLSALHQATVGNGMRGGRIDLYGGDVVTIGHDVHAGEIYVNEPLAACEGPSHSDGFEFSHQIFVYDPRECRGLGSAVKVMRSGKDIFRRPCIKPAGIFWP